MFYKFCQFVVILVLSVWVNVSVAGDTPNGKPFLYLETKVTDIETDVTDLETKVTDIENDLADVDAHLNRNGKRVSEGLYEVHSRLLWNDGMLKNDSLLDALGVYSYNEHEKDLVYGNDRTLFLRPLKSYGIPEPQPGSVRKVRLYVNYGHQWMCLGIPTIMIGDVEFSLPNISGHWAAMASGWSDFKDYAEYQHLGHTSIKVYLKDFVWDGLHCGSYPGTDRQKGAIYRVEAFFYDEFVD